MYELVDIMRQEVDLKFAQLLNRLRLNEMSEDDKNELRKRVVGRHLVIIQEMLYICLLKRLVFMNTMRTL